jgi:hypothetical protein
MVDHSYIEKVLALSTAHMPESNPNFGGEAGPRVVEFEYGYIIWVSSMFGQNGGDDIPEWLRPIMKIAYEAECTLILFDSDCSVDPDLKEYDW